MAFEAVATLLWTGELPHPAPRFEPGRAALGAAKVAPLLPAKARPLDRLGVALPLVALASPRRWRSKSAGRSGSSGCWPRRRAAGRGRPRRASRRRRWRTLPAGLDGPVTPAALRATDEALVLVADDELNPSSFAARVAASVGADLYACVVAALAVLTGPLHGGVCDRVEALVVEVGEPRRAALVIADRARRGEPSPGFGHPLSPDGDPRTPPLLDSARRLAPRDERVRTLLALVDEMAAAGLGAPTVDLGLVALAAALGLPPGSAVAAFAVGRSAAWMARALEQRAAGFQVRPRARCVGP